MVLVGSSSLEFLVNSREKERFQSGGLPLISTSRGTGSFASAHSDRKPGSCPFKPASENQTDACDTATRAKLLAPFNGDARLGKPDVSICVTEPAFLGK